MTAQTYILHLDKYFIFAWITVKARLYWRLVSRCSRQPTIFSFHWVKNIYVDALSTQKSPASEQQTLGYKILSRWENGDFSIAIRPASLCQGMVIRTEESAVLQAWGGESGGGPITCHQKKMIVINWQVVDTREHVERAKWLQPWLVAP